MWLPGNQSINTFTGFLKPDPENYILTIPSATDKAISRSPMMKYRQGGKFPQEEVLQERTTR